MNHLFRLCFLLLTFAIAPIAFAQSPTTQPVAFKFTDPLGTTWKTEGDVTIAPASTTQPAGLRFARTRDNFEKPTTAISPLFPVVVGTWDFGGVMSADMTSPDSSFNGSLDIELLDPTGKVVDRTKIGQVGAKSNRQPIRKQVGVPEGATQGRFVLTMNKAVGEFRVYELSARQLAGAVVGPIHRAIISHPQLGHMLFPEQARMFSIDVTARKVLPESSRHVRYVLRDYWGNDYSTPAVAKLMEVGDRPKEANYLYQATLDLSAAAVEVGQYYEIHATIPHESADPTRVTSAFVVLPEATTKKHHWKEIPFTSRNWDNRVPEYIRLSDRLGIRVVGIRSDWSAKPPFTMEAPQVELARSLNLGVLFRAPIFKIEHKHKGWEQYSPEGLRAGLREFWAKYGGDDAMMFIGNEPPKRGEAVKEDVAAYQAVYEELKKISPNTLIVGSAAGPEEDFFKYGGAKYGDVVDYHTYSGVNDIPRLVKRYDELFKKYNIERRPIWTTETGLNSQGLSRRAIAADLIKKVAVTFASGVENISWFTICWADTEGKLRGSAEDSFNVFDGLYGQFSPRLDAIAYYNMVNGVGIKKFINRKSYDNGAMHAVLMADKDGNALQVLWRDREARDVRLPLPGVKDAVTVKYIDGSISTLHASNDGVTIRVGEDPIILEYATTAVPTLAETLGEPAISINQPLAAVVSGASVDVELTLADGVTADQLQVVPPPYWDVSTVTAVEARKGGAKFTLTAPAGTNAREVPIKVRLSSADANQLTTGELVAMLPVRGELEVTVSPATTETGKPAVALDIRNNGSEPAKSDWKVSVTAAMSPVAGQYKTGTSNAVPATFGNDKYSGTVEVQSNAVTRIVLPLEEVGPQTCYSVRATLSTAADGEVAMHERWISGFSVANKVKSEITIDGDLNDADWSNAPAVFVNDVEQFRPLRGSASWTGVDDLSAEVRYLWDDQNFYMAVTIKDDILGATVETNRLWAQDGLQMMIDPARDQVFKPGKYDYGIAVSKDGPRAWCFLSGDSRAPVGEAKDIRVAMKRADENTGNRTYEVAIPWTRLAPFTAKPGANLGLALAINEDDSKGRDAFMSWFGDIQSKQVDAVGDILLIK